MAGKEDNEKLLLQKHMTDVGRNKISSGVKHCKRIERKDLFPVFLTKVRSIKDRFLVTTRDLLSTFHVKRLLFSSGYVSGVHRFEVLVLPFRNG